MLSITDAQCIFRRRRRKCEEKTRRKADAATGTIIKHAIIIQYYNICRVRNIIIMDFAAMFREEREKMLPEMRDGPATGTRAGGEEARRMRRRKSGARGVRECGDKRVDWGEDAGRDK